MTIKLEAGSYDPLDLSDLSLLLKEGNKKHNFKLYGASVISATEVVTDNINIPFMARNHQLEITFNCDYLEILNDNNKEEKLKEQKNDDEEITW